MPQGVVYRFSFVVVSGEALVVDATNQLIDTGQQQADLRGAHLAVHDVVLENARLMRHVVYRLPHWSVIHRDVVFRARHYVGRGAEIVDLLCAMG